MSDHVIIFDGKEIVAEQAKFTLLSDCVTHRIDVQCDALPIRAYPALIYGMSNGHRFRVVLCTSGDARLALLGLPCPTACCEGLFFCAHVRTISESHLAAALYTYDGLAPLTACRASGTL
jgi:hypothetical protein